VAACLAALGLETVARFSVRRTVDRLVKINQVGYAESAEKSAPHCKLPVVKALVRAGKVRATGSAYQGALELGINDLNGMCALVLELTYANFYKRMTTHADHQIWQDVYHAKTTHGDSVYLKLTVIDDVLIVSFKEL
jgi:motility quorum-sensing regulator/GCU-specific mRNA interferase toxin